MIVISGAGTAYSTRNFRLIFASSYFDFNFYAHFAYLFQEQIMQRGYR